MKLLLVFGCALAVGSAQPPTINYVPPVPPQQSSGTAGTVSLAAGVIACTITGAAPPSTAASVTVACVINSVTVPPYTVMLPTNASFVLQHTYVTNQNTKVFDAVTFGVSANPDGSPTLLWQGVATSGTMETASKGTL